MIKVKLNRVMAEKEISSKELANVLGLTEPNMSRLKKGNIKAMKLSTLNTLCKYLNCQVKDILEYQHDLED